MSAVMSPKLIDLNDWVLAGEGANGQLYYHRTDESLVLKLNREDMAADRAEKEFSVSKAVHDMGVRCPGIYDFVTDGKRIGVTGERIKDKKSFVRLISEDRSRLEPLAREFARRSKEFHSLQCDTAVFRSYKEKARAAYESCGAIPEEARRVLLSCLDDMSDDTTPVHGDFQPGNIIRSGERDYWIDLGDLTFGDPDIDFASLRMLAGYTPSAVVKYLFHISKKVMARFVEVYGAEYYGDRWHSRELDEKLDKALCLKMGMSIASRPRSAFMFLPYIMGRKFRANLIAGMCDLFLTEKIYRKKSQVPGREG